MNEVLRRDSFAILRHLLDSTREVSPGHLRWLTP